MTWQYAIRNWRLVELYDCPENPNLHGSYAVLDWRDAPHIVRDWRWVMRGVWTDWRR